MLVSYGIKGFKSFKDYVDINMYSNNKIKEFSDGVYKVNDNNSILPMMVLYGANGSGKTNFILFLTYLQKALRDFNDFKNTLKGVDDIIELQLELLLDGENCIYNFEYSKIQDEIISEEFGINSSDYHCVYRIKNGSLDEISTKYFDEETKKRIKIYVEDIYNKSLLLSKISSVEVFSLSIMSKFVKYLKRNVTNLSYSDNISPHYNVTLSNEDEKCNFLNELIKFDSDIIDISEELVNIDDIKSELPKRIYEKLMSDLDSEATNGLKRIMISNRDYQFVFEKEFDKYKVYKYVYNIKGIENAIDYSQLSDGTKAIIKILDTIIVEKNSIFIIDEIERSFHPILLKSLIKFIRKNSRENKNQFLITTHNLSLLDIDYFRRDEVNFIEKVLASSRIYNLNSYFIRKDTNIAKSYINGRFGAIPNILNLEE